MFDAESTETFAAINELCSLSSKSKKPIVVWVGAGASAWCGLPLWSQLADLFHKEYGRFESSYDRKSGNEFLSKALFPEFFSYCKQINAARFNNFLVASLKTSANPPPVYARFISALKTTKPPLQILTTNVDEALEQNLQLPVILPADLERLKTLIQSQESFIAKLHGSVSAVNSTIFTTEDYALLKTNSAYIDSIKTIFDLCCVLFIGYGLQDEYVLEILRRIEDLNAFFGAGPHFALILNDSAQLPASVRKIKYIAQPHADHRACIQIIEELAPAKDSAISTKGDNLVAASDICSAHFLSDVLPVGTWQTSQTFHGKSQDGKRELHCVVGHGITQSELPTTDSTALHDFIVGLICFDKIYAPLASLNRLFILIGENIIVELVKSNVLYFVYSKWNDVIFSHEENSLIGKIASIRKAHTFTGDGEETSLEFIQRQLKPVAGKEKEAEEMFALVAKNVIDSGIGETVVPSQVRSLLLRPSMRRMLGISEAVNLSAIPKWIQFPVLRLAQVVRIGISCRDLHIASVKFEFGNDKLAGPVFATATGNEFASNLASYVLAGNFSTDLGTFIQQNPTTLLTILKFRESAQGIELRKEILSHLAVSAGGEIAASVNAGLSSVIPIKILEQARHNFAQLSVTNRPLNYPAVWNDANYGNKALGLWKKRSLEEFQAICSKFHLSSYDLCPCGSGEKVKFCCGASLA